MRPVRKADNLPPSWAVVMKSGDLNLLEPSGRLQACNGTDLHLPYNLNVQFQGQRVNEILGIVYRCEDCSSAAYGWTTVCSHFMCRKI